jgi:hypothetical protein
MPISDGRPSGNFNQGAQNAIEALGKYDQQHGGKLHSALTNAQQIVQGADIKLEACDMIGLSQAMRALEKDNPGIKGDMKELNKALVNKFEGNPAQCKP